MVKESHIVLEFRRTWEKLLLVSILAKSSFIRSMSKLKVLCEEAHSPHSIRLGFYNSKPLLAYYIKRSHKRSRSCYIECISSSSIVHDLLMLQLQY